MARGSRAQFAQALTGAVQASGLTHQEIIRRLRDQGDLLSAGTFESWREGRSHPDRAATIASVVSLEQVLGLPPGQLVATLPGRRLAHPPVPLTWQDGAVLHASLRDSVDRMREELGLPWDDGLRRVSAYHHLTVHEDGTQGRHYVREGLVADRDGPACLMKYQSVADPHAHPFIAAISGCRLGRVLEDPSVPCVLAELVFPQPLREGEAVRVEFEYGAVGATLPDAGSERAVSAHLKELIHVIRFQGPPPKSIVAVDVIDEREKRRRVVLEDDNSVIVHRRDLGTGRYGVWWSWDADLRDPKVPLPY
ncbi:MAG: hypothetical protein LCH98_19310 [Actinobacteria bacterium]|nr:hypothetical protein [Actinomycetota bacterium]